MAAWGIGGCDTIHAMTCPRPAICSITRPRPRTRIKPLRRPRSGVALVAALTFLLLSASPRAFAQTQVHRLDEAGWQAQATGDVSPEAAALWQARTLIVAGEAEQAKDLTRDWLDEHPRHPLEPQARLILADALAAEKSYFKSLFEYEYLIRAFPATPEFFTALEREYEIARLFCNGVKRKFLGMRIIPAEGEGEELLIRIQERAPGSALAEKALLFLADHYYDNGEMDLAAETYDVFLLNYQESERREWAMLRLVRAYLATFKGPEFNSTGLLDAMQWLQRYEDEFPSAARRQGIEGLRTRIEESLASKALLVADWYRRRDKDVSAATLYDRVVRDYPTTSAAYRAVDRLKAMGRLAPRQRPAKPGNQPDVTDDTAPASDGAAGAAPMASNHGGAS